uniref:Meckelin n=2 Tax=Bombyx mori TaxID=7091 RepID=A0A8R2M3S9_BOMMO|nr:meckelin [Bombyx mori]
MRCIVRAIIMICCLSTASIAYTQKQCEPEAYYDPGLLGCQSCPANSSMITSLDGFGCRCDEHSVPEGPAKCKPCNATELVSADRSICVPRRCQNVSGRFVCRKCPSDYISVTQNFDGSPMKEVQCVKCARGYKADNNVCFKCEGCACSKNEIVIRGICVPKTFLNTRPKYEKTLLHPLVLLDVIKYEYLCTQKDYRACRTLVNICVKNFYLNDLAGPCRLWLQTKLPIIKGLPALIIESSDEKQSWNTDLSSGKNEIKIAVAVYTKSGGLKFLSDKNVISPCHLPVKFKIGDDLSFDCSINITDLTSSSFNETLAPFISFEDNFEALPVSLKKPDGQYVQKQTWPSYKFRRYFLVHKELSAVSNTSNVIYLRTLYIRLRIEKVKHATGGLRLEITTETEYANAMTSSATSSLKIEHHMPDAGIFRGLEIWGFVLGTLTSLYALVQWRGVVRRGASYASVVPLVSAALADTLYFSALISTVHALAAEAGTLPLVLPLSKREESIIKMLIYSSVSLKVIKVVWVNWKQCRSDIFFLDWSLYNSPWRDEAVVYKSEYWKTSCLVREWSLMQTKRKAPLGYTITITLLILYVLKPWKSSLPKSDGYKWAVTAIAWWSSYSIVFLLKWALNKVAGSDAEVLPKSCTALDVSVLVFEEEYYAHYVHGRNDESKEMRTLAGPLAICRIVCSPQLRAVYKQLSTVTPGAGLGVAETKQIVLSKFLAAFIERALDGMSWVASERTFLEKLLGIELSTRETGSTSTLLYDDSNTPSCFAVTWWGEEWTLSTFDAMFYSCIFVATDEEILAALITLILFQLMKIARSWFGNRNVAQKLEI